MPDFGQVARKHQAHFRDTSPTISAEGRSPKDPVGLRNGHLLELGYEPENLYPTLRNENGAIEFFIKRSVKWHRSGRSGDARGVNGPTRNMASSQIMCVNFLLPLAEIDGALTAVVRAIDPDVKDVVDIQHGGNVSPVEFEWIGLGGPLESGASPTRGTNVTSIDAFILAGTHKALRAYLIEWKYVEEYRIGDNKGEGRSGETRRSRYERPYAESLEFSGSVPMDELLYEPFYQLLRLRLLADRMVADKEFDVSEAKVVVVAPEGNIAYRERITSSPLAKRFPHLDTIDQIFRATLKRPDEAFAMIGPSALVDAVERESPYAASDWAAYMRGRYAL